MEKLLEVQISYLFSKLDVAESARNWPVAISLGQRIFALLPDHEEARARTAAAYFNRCKRNAEKDNKTIKRTSDPYHTLVPSRPHYVSGGLAGTKGERDDLEQAVTLDPNNAEVYYWLSALFYGEKQIEKLTHAIEHDPGNGKYYYRRSQIRERLHLEGTDISLEGRDKSDELRAQARQRGRQRVNDAAQRDFDRALELGYEEAVAEKNYKEPDFSFLNSEPFVTKDSFLNELLKLKK